VLFTCAIKYLLPVYYLKNHRFCCIRTSHQLSDSDIPLEFVRFHLVDYVVHSLRDMEDYKYLVTDWSALLRALESEEPSVKRKGRRAESQESDDENDPNVEEHNRHEAMKQRVVLRMLTCAVELEVAATSNGSFLENDIDPDLLHVLRDQQQSLGVTKPKKAKVSSHEKLTVALLGALPDLLETFKGETSVLRDLTRVPKYFRK